MSSVTLNTKYALGMELSDVATSASSTSIRRVRSPEQSIAKRFGNDVERIHEMWKTTNTELKKKSREVLELKRQLLNSNQKHKSSVRLSKQSEALRQEKEELRDRIHFAEKQLTVVREANDKYAQRFEEIQSERERLSEELLSTRNVLEERSDTMRNLQRRIQDLESEKTSIARNSMEEVRNYDEELQLANKDLRKMKMLLHNREDETRRLREETSQQQLQIVKLEEAARKNLRNAERATTTVDRMRTELQAHRSVVLGEQQLKIENEHLKIDNARIVRLLSSTKEYSQFQSFWEDGGGVTYLPEPSKKEKRRVTGRRGPMTTNHGTRSSSSSLSSSSAINNSANDQKHDVLSTDPVLLRSLVGPSGAWGDVRVFEKVYNISHHGVDRPVKGTFKLEKVNWLPTDALRLSIDFKLRHLPHVSMDLIGEFLRQLNEIWRLREKRHIARLKRKLGKQISGVKRNVLNKVPYAEVIQRNKIAALTREVKELRAAMAGAGTNITSGLGLGETLSTGLSGKLRKGENAKLLEASLATVENLSRKVQELHMANAKLRQELKNVSSKRGASDQSFIDGAAWFGRNAVVVADKMGEKVDGALKDIRGILADQDINDPVIESGRDGLSQAVLGVEDCVTEGRIRIRKLFTSLLDASRDTDPTNTNSILSGDVSSINKSSSYSSNSSSVLENAASRAPSELDVSKGNLLNATVSGHLGPPPRVAKALGNAFLRARSGYKSESSYFND